MTRRCYALSLKQPWAALVVLGLKTIEVRRWRTQYRGPLLIHASRLWDSRGPAPETLPPEAQALLAQRGGILGQVNLVECKSYKNLGTFTAEKELHWNRPEWFVPPLMFGFRLTAPRLVPFVPCKGQVRLFGVDWKAV